MRRCAVCQIQSSSTLCGGCQTLIHAPKNPCQICAKPLNVAGGVCGECRQDPPPFGTTHCAAVYQEPVNQWVQQLKFGERMDRARLMAEAMAPTLVNVSNSAVLVPMPLHTSRLKSRGYNQAHELTRLLSKMLGLAVGLNLLLRTKATAMQAELPEKQRQANVRGAFQVNTKVTPKHVVLVDDVLTTGQTLRSAAKTLKQAGVERVDVAVFARSGG